MGQTKGQGLSRRSFLHGVGSMIAFPTILSATALGSKGRPAASERIVMGTIGFGGRGSHVMPAFMREDDVQMVAVCDVKKIGVNLGRTQSIVTTKIPTAMLISTCESCWHEMISTRC